MHRLVRRTAVLTVAVGAAAVFAAACNSDNKPSVSGSASAVPAPAESPTGALAGAIGAKYEALGGKDGVLGPPKGPEQDGPDDGKWQEFEGGAIFWTPNSGAHIIRAEVLRSWKDHGGAWGQLGYPTADESDAANGAKEAHFIGGTITWLDGKSVVTTR